MRKAGSNENLSGKPKVPSEKHDVLYSKARYVLNQRHIKRPWFNLNPFLEKTDESLDLENFLPGESKYIQPLESLVLSESFHRDHPLDTRELSIDAFFTYLFSDESGKGCSIRVLEGQLLEQLLLGLYRLENDGFAVRHTTHAFARNHRPRTGCYKFPDRESSGTVEETLVIEFAHFGRLTKEKPNPTTLNPFEYLKRKEEDNTAESDETKTENANITDLPVVAEISEKRRDRAMSINVESVNMQPFSPNTPDNKPNWGRRGSLMSKHVNAIRFLNALQPEGRRQSIATQSFSPETKRHSLATPNLQPVIRKKITTGLPALSESRRQTVPTQPPGCRRHSIAVNQTFIEKQQLNLKSIQQKRRESTGQQRTDESGYFKSVDQKTTKRYQRKIYSLDFDDSMSEIGEVNEENEEELPPEEKDVFFGEEFYLSDQKWGSTNHLRSVKKILQQKKKELHERREEDKRQREIQLERIKQLVRPKLPNLDVNDLDTYMVKHDTISMPDTVPTLEEFVQLLKDDEYYDPRYRNRVRLKSKKIAQRYYIAKGMHRTSVLFSLADIPDEVRNIGCYRRTSCNTSLRKKKDSISGKSKAHLARMSTLMESDRQGKHTLPLPEVKNSSSLLSIQRRGQEVLAVTDSEPCKDHYIKSKKHSLADTVVTTTSSDSPIFPKATLCDEDDEPDSSDIDSEESTSDSNFDDNFDTKKLNFKYSIERLRKKRRSRVKKKPGIIEVLAKYYNMQNALRVFRKGSAGKESKKARMRARQLGKKKQSEKQSVDEGMIIGKLRKFSFLDVKEKKKLNLDNLPRGDFSSPNLVKFHEQLKEALER